MDDEQQPDAQPEEPHAAEPQVDEPAKEGAAHTPPPDEAAQANDGTTTPPPEGPGRSRRIFRPTEVLDRLDRQWEDPTPLRQRVVRATGLVMTVPEDPAGFDYLGAMGLSDREAADLWLAWLDAQLAADVLELGGLLRPKVALVPAGRLWYVVRVVAGILVVIDGPGFLTPAAAVIAARRRYRALIQEGAERGRKAAHLPDADGDEEGRDLDAALSGQAADDHSNDGDPRETDRGAHEPSGEP